MRIIVFSITLIMGGGGGHNTLSRYGESLVQWITCGTSANIILTIQLYNILLLCTYNALFYRK